MSSPVKSSITVIIICTLLTLSILTPSAIADIELPKIISDQMILQRNRPVHLWGWADAGEQIAVKLAGNTASTTADAKGRWSLDLDALPAGGPHTLMLKGKNSVTVNDIMIGEVWLCSGQSNMEFQVRQAETGAEEIEKADFENLRFFYVHRKTSPDPLDRVDPRCQWRPCNSEHVHWCSAIGYFFGKKIHLQTDLPVGLIVSSWGGTPIEAWTPAAGFRQVPQLSSIAEKVASADEQYDRQLKAMFGEVEDWLDSARTASAADGDIPSPPAWPEHPLDGEHKPTSLYNAMINPLKPYNIRGAIWYQGESNLGDAMLYYHKMNALIGSWRDIFENPELSFYYVQLAPYRYNRSSTTLLPEMWEAQTAALKLPHTGMAVIHDTVANLNDIHPKNKRVPGERLALWALAKDYGKDIAYSGPLYHSMQIEDGKARIRFSHVEGGLGTSDSKPPSHFQIAGPDKEFTEAKTRIDGQSVLVWHPDIDTPTAVRFAWHEAAQPNLYNKAGLPACPFRTDGP